MGKKIVKICEKLFSSKQITRFKITKIIYIKIYLRIQVSFFQGMFYEFPPDDESEIFHAIAKDESEN